MGIEHFGDFTPDMNEQITANFTLGDFCPTETGFSNIPDQAAYNYIKTLMAPQAQKLYDSIGPFKIISGFRAAAVQAAVQTQQSPTKSFHEVGCAIDFYPTGSDDIYSYFGKMLADPYWTGTFYELFLKPPQKSIHISIDPSGRTNMVKIMSDDKGAYVPASSDQIAELISDATQGTQSFNIADTTPSSGDSSSSEGDSDVTDQSQLTPPTFSVAQAGGLILFLAGAMIVYTRFIKGKK